MSVAETTVLYLTSRMCFPPYSGGQRREYELIRRLSLRADVHLRVVTQFPETDTPGIAHMRQFCASVEMTETDRPVTGPPSVPARVWRQASARMTAQLLDDLAGLAPDLVHVEGYYMLQHLPSRIDVPIALVEENIEYLLDRQWETLGIRDAHSIADDGIRVERAAWRRAAACGTATLEDAAHIRSVFSDVDVHWCPHGADPLRLDESDLPRPVERSASMRRVAFLGSYAFYPPNEDATQYLLDDIWPRVARRIPQAELVLAGTGLGPDIAELARACDRVTVMGEVESVSHVYDHAHVVVAPMRVGGGVKVKVLEALTHGCPVVASPLGAQGLPDEARDAVAIGRDGAELADRLVELLSDREARLAATVRTLSAARVLPTWDEAAERLWGVWTAALATRADSVVSRASVGADHG